MWRRTVPWLGILGALTACLGSSSSSPAPAPAEGRLQIRTTSGAPLEALGGDALELEVAYVHADGSSEHLPAAATVVWIAPARFTALAPGSAGARLVTSRAPGVPPLAAWLDNPSRLASRNVLFILDPGTEQNGAVEVVASVAGAPHTGTATAHVAVSPAPAGDATRGASLFGANGADCASCHGPSGHGSVAASGGHYVMGGATYDFPAPGINAEPNNLASDPSWNASLLAVAARADVDNHGVTLRAPMPSWLESPDPKTGNALTTQDFVDIYAFLRTQIR